MLKLEKFNKYFVQDCSLEVRGVFVIVSKTTELDGVAVQVDYIKNELLEVAVFCKMFLMLLWQLLTQNCFRMMRNSI